MNALETPVSRRAFLRTGAAAGGALLLGIDFVRSGRAAAASAAGGRVGVWISIAADETITIIAPNSEMGQGTSSALPQIVAEELKVEWSQVRLQLAGADPAFANPLFHAQLTGGSTAVRGYHDALRLVGATAREMLIAAGAKRLRTTRADCVAEAGSVRSLRSGRSATYGQLAAAAARIAPPKNPPLTPRDQLRLIGHPLPRLDIPSKVDGSAVYGIDVRLPGMLYAAVRQAPKVGQRLGSHGSPGPGLQAVVVPGGVAVVGPTTWQAMRAVRALAVTWIDGPDTAASDTAAMDALAGRLMDTGLPVRVGRNDGDATAALARAARTVTATYAVPYLPHATLEPQNATALVTATTCEVWAPTQAQGLCVATAAGITGLMPSQVTVHTTFLGGGLGRRFEQDFIAQAVTVAKALPGTPVKLTWSREEDFTHDVYRPSALCRISAGLDAAGAPLGFLARIVSPSILYQRNPRAYDDPKAVDSQAVEGLTTLLYGIHDQRVEWIRHPSAVPVGFWRSVGNSHNVFFAESMVDELAAAAGKDPVAFRRSMLSANPRATALLDRLAQASGWGTAPARGQARGVALCECFGSLVGVVAEVSGTLAAGFRVAALTIALDCGSTINPDTVRAQLEGAVIQGYAAAMWSDMPFRAGQPMRRNFNTFRMPRLREVPPIATVVIESGAALGGVGEPGLPCVAPAIANALAVLGARPRRLPFLPQAVPAS